MIYPHFNRRENETFLPLSTMSPKDHAEIFKLRRVFELGSPLYIPALHPHLRERIFGSDSPPLRSIIICAEDSLWPTQRSKALENIESLLWELFKAHSCGDDPSSYPPSRLFIRPESPEALVKCLEFEHIDQVQGFVLPKFDLYQLESYLTPLSLYMKRYREMERRKEKVFENKEKVFENKEKVFEIMPILETSDAFHPDRMRALQQQLSVHPLRSQIIALRIGSHDLLNILALRRHEGETIYNTPIREIISQLVTIFRPHDFFLCGSAYDGIADLEGLRDEVHFDLQFGLFGKSAIHPNQVKVIEESYQVSQVDVDSALSALNINTPATSAVGDRMIESQVHGRWARVTLLRAEIFGVCKTTPHLQLSTSQRSLGEGVI